MSGGALDYLYNRVEEAAEKIVRHYGQPGRRTEQGVAFGKLLMKVSKALRDVEWDMSGDGSDWKHVNALIKDKQVAKSVAEDLQEMINAAQAALNSLKGEVDEK